MWIFVVAFIIGGLFWAYSASQGQKTHELLAPDTADEISSLSSPTTARFEAQRELPKAGGYELDIVGESYYLSAFTQLCGPRRARGVNIETLAALRREPNNPHDSNAVGIYIEDLKVGHLSREDAVRYKDLIEQTNQQGYEAVSPARIKGGWDDGDTQGHYGVKLDLAEPAEEILGEALDHIRSLKTPRGRKNALEKHLDRSEDAAMKAQLIHAAMQIEVDATLAKAHDFDTTPAKRAIIEKGLETIEQSEVGPEGKAALKEQLLNALITMS